MSRFSPFPFSLSDASLGAVVVPTRLGHVWILFFLHFGVVLVYGHAKAHAVSYGF